MKKTLLLTIFSSLFMITSSYAHPAHSGRPVVVHKPAHVKPSVVVKPPMVITPPVAVLPPLIVLPSIVVTPPTHVMQRRGHHKAVVVHKGRNHSSRHKSMSN